MDIVMRSHERRVCSHEEKLRQQQLERDRNPYSFSNPAILESFVGARGYPFGGKPPRSKPLSDKDIEAKLAQFNEGLRQRWGRCTEYLASVTSPALHFWIVNQAKSFPKNVQVVLRFEGAAFVYKRDTEDFCWQKLEGPSWRPVGLYGMTTVPLNLPRPADDPVHPKNIGQNLEIKINLAELRPEPPTESEHDDIVLIAHHSDRDEINVNWFATAEGYGEAFHGSPIRVPVVPVDMVEAAKSALESSKEAS
jgi:hypothetical protein